MAATARDELDQVQEPRGPSEYSVGVIRAQALTPSSAAFLGRCASLAELSPCRVLGYSDAGWWDRFWIHSKTSLACCATLFWADFMFHRRYIPSFLCLWEEKECPSSLPGCLGAWTIPTSQLRGKTPWETGHLI